MEEFLPSEIARAVYGYLISEGCEEAAKVFFDTSENFTECRQQVKKGKRITLSNTLLLGRNLTDLLNIACSVYSLVLQANKKQQTGKEKDEGWTKLFEEIRSFILSESTSQLSRTENSNSEVNFSKNTFLSATEVEGFSPLRPASQNESSLHFDLNSQLLDTPKRPSLETTSRVSLADNYKSLVEECQKGLDLSLSPDKNCSSNKTVPCLSSTQVNEHTTASKTISCPELEVDNQSAVTAIAGIAFGAPQTAQVIPVSSTSNLSQILPPGNLYRVVSSMPYSSPCLQPCESLPQTVMATSSNPLQVTSVYSSAPLVTSSTPTSFVASQPGTTAVTSCFPQPIVVPTHSVSSGFQLDGITRLPDPPIILLNELNQPIPFDSHDPSASYFGLPPNAASTPHPSQASHFAPQDTAIIIYPPLVTDLPPKKTKGKKEKRPIRSTKLRKLLPKPPRKDPPDILHIKILPQQLLVNEDEDSEKDSANDNQEDGNSDNNLAEELPNTNPEEPIVIITEREAPVDIGDINPENNFNNDNENEEVPVEIGDINPENNVNNDNENEEVPVEIGDMNPENNEDMNPENNEDMNPENNVNNDNKNEKEEPTIPVKTVQETSIKGAELADKKSEVKTPKPPRLKKNISRSTPRRNSHVRALSFNTPHKPMLGRKANTSPKMPKIQFSPRSSKFDHVKRSSLFKSPPSPKNSRELSRLTEEDEDEAKESEGDDSEQEPVIHSPLAKVPIATRSPAPKLSAAWKEVNDVTITEKPIKKTGKPITTSKKPVEKIATKVRKPQWDDKIRSFICGDFVDPVPPPKKQFKEKPNEKTSPAVKKAAAKSENNDSSVRRSTRLINSSESPLKNSFKSNNKSKRKTSPKKLKNSSTSLPSKTVVNKTSNKFSRKPILKMNKKIITPEIVESSTEDSSSSNENISKSVKTNLNRSTTNPNSSITLASKTSSNKCQNNQSETNNCKVVESSTSEDSSSSNENISKSVKTNPNRGITSPNKTLETKISSSKCQNNQTETNNCKEDVNTDSPNITSNILLEDLVVSSNSCFPLAVEECAKEQFEANPTNSNIKKVMDCPTDDQLKHKENSNKETVSPKFALPFIPVQETPLKDIQAVFPATPVLNTPFMKNIIKETSVLEEDLLLTPSLPPTPQVNSPHNLGRTPSKPIEVLGTFVVAKQNSYPPKEVEGSNKGSQIGSDSPSKISSNSKTTNNTVSPQKITTNTSSANITDRIVETKITASPSRSSNTSKDNLTTSSDSSDEEIVKTFLNCSRKNQSTFKPTVKTRIIQGPVSAKTKGYVNNRKIYTSSDSSDEENNDINVSKAKSDKLHKESNPSLSDLRSRLLIEERNRIESLPKAGDLGIKQKTSRKIKSQVKNKISGKTRSGSSKSNLSIEKRKNSPQLNKSPMKSKASPTKEKSYVEDNQKILRTPEKMKLENDLLKQERQNIFGDDLQLSSDSESEQEFFEKKKQTNKPKNSILAIPNKSLKNQDIFVSDDSSIEEVNKSNTICNSSKTVRFETTTEVRIIEDSNSVHKSLDADVNTNTFNTLKNITENSERRINETLSTVTEVNSPELCSNFDSTNKIIIDSADFQSKNHTKNVSSHEMCSNTSKAQISAKDKYFDINEKGKGSNEPHGKNNDSFQAVVSSSSVSKTINSDKISTDDKSDSGPEFSLPKAPTAYLENTLPQSHNSSTVIDHDVPKDVNEVDKSESHISVISNESTRNNTKPVCLNVPQFDPDFHIGFETENGTIQLSYSKTMFHFEMPNATDPSILKRNVRQESLKTSNQKPSKGSDGKRRVKLTPVEEGKYEKLKVDYDIIDGKIISKRDENRKSFSEADILDCTCSTIDADSTPDSSTKNKMVSVNRFDFKSSQSSLKDRGEKNESKESKMKSISKYEETKNLSQSSSGRTAQTRYKTTGKEMIPPILKTPIKHSETSEQKLHSNKKSVISAGLKEAKLKRTITDELIKQSDKKPVYENKQAKIQLDKRKEVELRDRRRERDIPERFSRREQSSRYLSRREEDRRKYSERRHHRSPERYHRSHLDRRRDPRKYYAKSPPHEDYDRNSRYSDRSRSRESNRFSKSKIYWKDVDDVKEQENKNSCEEELKEVLDPRSQKQQLTSYSDVEKNLSSDGADSLMDFAVLTKSKRKRLPSSSLSSSSPGKESLPRSEQSSKRKASLSGEDVSEKSQANKKLKMEEKDMREAKSVLKHKMADMLNVLHPDTSNEAS